MSIPIAYGSTIPNGYEMAARYDLPNHLGLSISDASGKIAPHLVVPLPDLTDAIFIGCPDWNEDVLQRCYKFDNVKVEQPEADLTLYNLTLDAVWWRSPFTLTIHVHKGTEKQPKE